MAVSLEQRELCLVKQVSWGVGGVWRDAENVPMYNTLEKAREQTQLSLLGCIPPFVRDRASHWSGISACNPGSLSHRLPEICPFLPSYVTFSTGPWRQASVGSRNLRGKCLLTAISPALTMGLPSSRIQKRCRSVRHTHSKQEPCARISKMQKIQWKPNCLCFQIWKGRKRVFKEVREEGKGVFFLLPFLSASCCLHILIMPLY